MAHRTDDPTDDHAGTPADLASDDRPLVLVTSRSFSSGDYDAFGALVAAGARVEHTAWTHDPAELAAPLNSAVAWIAGTSHIDDELLATAPALRLIARYGVGVDAVDLESAERRGIAVTNTPTANTLAVADLALAHMLAALRDLRSADRRVRRGDWSVVRGHELGDQTVGIIGFGRIGRAVAARLGGFGARILAHDPWLSDEAIREAGAEPVSLEALLAQSQVITLHTPGTEQVITAERLEGVHPGAVLVNTARANLVDEDAVAAALRDHRLGFYAADTLAEESTSPSGDDGHTSPLLATDLADRTEFSPHAGAHTVEAVDRMGQGAVESVIALLRGEQLPNLVVAPRTTTTNGATA